MRNDLPELFAKRYAGILALKWCNDIEAEVTASERVEGFVCRITVQPIVGRRYVTSPQQEQRR